MPREMLLLSAVLLCSCATMTDKAAKVQVHSQVSTLLDSCKKLGPANATANNVVDVSFAIKEAKTLAREKAADMGGDTLAIINIDLLSGTEATVQGIALRCY